MKPKTRCECVSRGCDCGAHLLNNEVVLENGAAPCLRVSYSAVGVLHIVHVAI